MSQLADLAGDLRAVELAALFHDAVYDAAAPAGANEAASAQLAADVLGDDPAVAEVRRLVLLTAGHAVDRGDRNGAVLVDADLWILGASPGRYDRYAVDVRAEYAHVDDGGWHAGRAAVLRSFLDRERIYATDRFHDLLDAPARLNLRRELASLESSDLEAKKPSRFSGLAAARRGRRP